MGDDYVQATWNSYSSTLKETAQVQTGYSTMLEELYGGNETESVSGVNGAGYGENIHRGRLDFLTKSDRDLIGKMYDYADQNNIDHQYIRSFAWDLGRYRKLDDGDLLSNFNDGSYDGEGHKLTLSFLPENEEALSKLESSGAKNSTLLDKGFIDFMSDPGLAGLNPSGSYEFLSQMASVFNTNDLSTPYNVNQFSSFKVPTSDNKTMTLNISEKVVLARPEPDIITVNGVTTVTEKGRANGVTLAGESPEQNQIYKEIRALEDLIKLLGIDDKSAVISLGQDGHSGSLFWSLMDRDSD